MPQTALTQIGKYKIVGQVGEGAMGIVYRALDPILNRPVAIKVMSDAIACDDDLRGRFLREAQAAGSLQHPNVITIYDFGEVSGHLYIAMEFVEGEDLEDLQAKHIALSLVDKLDIIIDVLGGLAYAHKRGIIHRDVKPANIRIDEEGRARIMDFGIAHLSSSNMTRTGVMVGTPAYMAPEQIVGSGIVPATDLFSVGAVLYELLSGSKPFEGDSLQTVMYKIVSQPAPKLATSSLGIPPALDGIVQRALAKDVKDRYQSALEMANALTQVRAALDRDSHASKTVSLRSVIELGLTAEREANQRKVKRRTTGIVAALVGAVSMIVILGALLLRSSSAPRSDAPTSTPSAVPPPPTTTVAAVQPTSVPETGPKAAPSSKPVATGEAATQQAIPKAPKVDAKTPSSDALVLVRALQTTALESRRRAVEAGATTDQLKAGDETSRAADAFVAKGKLAEAAAKLNEATTAWGTAEREARSASSAAGSRSRLGAADAPKPDLPVPPATSTSTPPSTAAANVPPPQTAAKPPLPTVNSTAEIEAAVAAYARAIESRDIAEVRRAYPGITPAQATGFEQFFTSVRSLRATFSLSSVDVNGATAEGKLAGAYDYLTTAGKTERQPVSFQASFRREAGGWKLASVR